MKNLQTIICAGLCIVLLTVITSFAAEGDGSAMVPKEKVMLWNGRDFTGWKLFVPDENYDVTKTWSIGDDVLRCTGKPGGYMRTEKDYGNYHLHVEWRWPGDPGNNGVLIHMSEPDVVWPKSLECQLFTGNAGDFWVIGGVETEQHAKGGKRVQGRRTVKLKDSSEKAPSQWNNYDIVCCNDWVVVLVNGVLQNVATRCSVTSGKICLQSEGAAIEYRNIYIEPLE